MPFPPPDIPSPDRPRSPIVMVMPRKIVANLRLSQTIRGTHRADTLSALPINPPSGSSNRFAIYQPPSKSP
jgi:hypothetical protein